MGTQGDTDKLLAATERTVSWLLGELQPDGSLGPEFADLACYQKAPLLLARTGHARTADKLLEYIAETYQTRSGSFQNLPDAPASTLGDYAGYADGWLAMTSQRVGRFDLARPSWAHLRRFDHSRNGGFCLTAPFRGDGTDVIELLTTAHLGLTALYCGELPLALSAGRALRDFCSLQPEPERRLYLRMNDSGELITDFPEQARHLHVVEIGTPDQLWFFVGHPLVFLVQLARATSSAEHMAAAHLETAQTYAAFALACGETMTREHSSHQVGRGAALLHWATGKREHAELAHVIAEQLLGSQSEAGTWLDDGPAHVRMDQSIEAALCLHEIATLS